MGNRPRKKAPPSKPGDAVTRPVDQSHTSPFGRPTAEPRADSRNRRAGPPTTESDVGGAQGSAGSPVASGMPPPRRSSDTHAVAAEVNAPAESIPVSATRAPGLWERTVSDALPPWLAATYWFDIDPSAPAHPTAVRFAGERINVDGKRQERDVFERTESLNGIGKGIGRVAVTARVQGINSGTWRVTAVPLSTPVGASPAQHAATDREDSGRQVMTVSTHPEPLAHGPAVRPGAWPLLVGLGWVVAIGLQAVVIAKDDADVAAAVLISLVASAVGFIGAKFWFLTPRRGRSRGFISAGACIQGFLLGAFATLAMGGVAFHLPVGLLLDAATPGVFLGLAIGRPGCLLTGCCYGRPTDSRWGLWSSDRRVAIRRVPVQLLEAALALALASASLALVLTVHPAVAGTIFVAAVAAYTACRQLLFPFRAESHTPRGRAATLSICLLLLVVDAALLLFMRAV